MSLLDNLKLNDSLEDQNLHKHLNLRVICQTDSVFRPVMQNRF